MMMLGDDNKNVKSVEMAKVLAHRKQAAEESANNDDCPHVPNSSLVRMFNVPTLNLEANAYYELTHFNSDQQQLSATANPTTTFRNCIILS